MTSVKYPAWDSQDKKTHNRRVEAGKHAEQQPYNAPTAVVAAGAITAGRVIVAHPKAFDLNLGHGREDSGWRSDNSQLATLPDDTGTFLIDGQLGVNFTTAGYDAKISDGKYHVLGVSIWNEFNMGRNFNKKTYGAFDGELIAETSTQECGAAAGMISYTMERSTYGYACGEIDPTKPLFFNTTITQAQIDDPLNTISLGGFNTDGVGQAFPWGRARTACVAGDTFIIEFVPFAAVP